MRVIRYAERPGEDTAAVSQAVWRPHTPIRSLSPTALTGTLSKRGIGLFIRDASDGLIGNKVLRRNCAGVWLLDGSVPGSVNNWIARDNLVRKNTGACLPSEDIPIPISGFGIVLAGRDHVVLDDNAVAANQPTGDIRRGHRRRLDRGVRRRRPDRQPSAT
jgi:hypothetical protein